MVGAGVGQISVGVVPPPTSFTSLAFTSLLPLGLKGSETDEISLPFYPFCRVPLLEPEGYDQWFLSTKNQYSQTK